MRTTHIIQGRAAQTDARVGFIGITLTRLRLQYGRRQRIPAPRVLWRHRSRAFRRIAEKMPQSNAINVANRRQRSQRRHHPVRFQLGQQRRRKPGLLCQPCQRQTLVEAQTAQFRANAVRCQQPVGVRLRTRHLVFASESNFFPATFLNPEIFTKFWPPFDQLRLCPRKNRNEISRFHV